MSTTSFTSSTDDTKTVADLAFSVRDKTFAFINLADATGIRFMDDENRFLVSAREIGLERPSHPDFTMGSINHWKELGFRRLPIFP
jgi:hypothetical protein